MENHKNVLFRAVHVQLFATIFLQQGRIRHQLFVSVDVAHLVLGIGYLILQILDFTIQVPMRLEVMIGKEEKIRRKQQERHHIQYDEEAESVAEFRVVFHCYLA